MDVNERTICDDRVVKEYSVYDLNEYIDVTTSYQRQRLTFRGQAREYLTEAGMPLIKSRLLRHKSFMDVSDWRDYDASLAEWARRVIEFFPSESHLRPVHYAGVTNSPLFNPRSSVLWDLYLFGSLATSEKPAIVALMQHYGFPTHFIDLTTDPLVALWFATHRLVEVTPNVWTYRPLSSLSEADRSSWPAVYVFAPAPETLFLEDVGLDVEKISRPFCQHAAFYPEVIRTVGKVGVITRGNLANLVVGAIIKLRPPASLETGLDMADLFPLEDRDPLYARMMSAPCQHFTRYSY